MYFSASYIILYVSIFFPILYSECVPTNTTQSKYRVICSQIKTFHASVIKLNILEIEQAR